MNTRAIICTCIKDENDYLAEWIEYHLNLGFEHIYLFEDYGSKSHQDIVDRYSNVTLLPIEVVEGEPITEERRQRKMMYYSIRVYKDTYDWIAFIDADEFVEFEDGYNLERLLSEHSELTSIYLSWRLYGANGRIQKPKGSVIESYPLHDDETNYGYVFGAAQWSVKSFANLHTNLKIRNIHIIEGGVNMNGDHYPEYKVFKKAWIRHYYTKSWEEWLYRIMKRGDLCNANRKLGNFFEANPDMKHMKYELISQVADQLPVNCHILDTAKMLIAGGNVKIIEKLNNGNR